MAQKMQSDWVVPILEDLREFARLNRLSAFADDLDTVLDRHADLLRDPTPKTRKPARRATPDIVPFDQISSGKVD